MDKKIENMELYAWVGEDDTGEVGIKQGIVPAGIIPIVSVSRDKVTQSCLVKQMQFLTECTGKSVRLVRFSLSEILLTLYPDS